jgi:hypothetical protein
LLKQIDICGFIIELSLRHFRDFKATIIAQLS